MSNVLASVDWSVVAQHFGERIEAHRLLKRYLREKDVKRYVELALGIPDRVGNYGADEHKLGVRVIGLNSNALSRVFELGRQFSKLENGRESSRLIKAAQLKYLQIGVGSECACMINPNICWIANTRTIWAHLLIKHNDDAKIGSPVSYKEANEELDLYRDADDTSEMAYSKWVELHRIVQGSLLKLFDKSEEQRLHISPNPGMYRYLWADAIANYLYENKLG